MNKLGYFDFERYGTNSFISTPRCLDQRWSITVIPPLPELHKVL